MAYSAKSRCARLMIGVAASALILGASPALAQEISRIDLAPQSLATALYEFGRQTGHQVIFSPELTKSKTSPGVSGGADEQVAMAQLLAGTGLTFRREGNTFMIVDASDPQSGSAAGDGAEGTVDALIVTAQKREEDIQDVPIAISAFTQEALEAQKIEGGFDLLKAIPNVTFSKNNFTSYNFSIRGIGTKAVSATTDPGVAVSFNNIALLQNRLFEQEYFDVERVEVLRGPQGTLYGRNATAGVINVISAKPDTDEFEGWIKGEVGNYHAKRVSAMINVPLLEDKAAIRIAGALTDREGYDYNSVTRNAVNGRSLWSGRVSVAINPIERLQANLIWERFEEDDDRSRTGKQLCHRDNGPTSVGGVPTTGGAEEIAKLLPALFSQGCKPGSLYDAQAFGTPNGLSLPFVFGMLGLGADCGLTCGPLFPLGWTEPFIIDNQRNPNAVAKTLIEIRDPYDGLEQSRDLRTIASFRDPVYRANADIIQLNLDFDLNDDLRLSSQTAYNKDTVYSFQDYNRFNTQPIFTDTSQLFENNGIHPDNPSPYRNLAPGGVFCDPQLGCSNTLAGFDISTAKSQQFSQEIRLQSDFDGPLNFSVGANYTRFNVLADYYVMFNLVTAFAYMAPLNILGSTPDGSVPLDRDECWMVGPFGSLPDVTLPVDREDPRASCIYVDPNPVESINGEGHNYFRSKNPYKLTSAAAFGEIYWNVRPDLKVTGGLRYTDDRKRFTPVPSQLLLSEFLLNLGAVNRGYPELAPIEQHWGEVSGRLGVDWQPALSFTDHTLLYGFYSHGYKGGGANPPGIGFGGLFGGTYAEFLPKNYGPTFEPEFVDAFEVGTKNVLAGGGVILNANAFFYDYKDYQVSQILDRLAVNDNYDALAWGLEFEAFLQPTPNLRVNGNLGFLDTRIADRERSVDVMNRTQGDTDYTLVRPWVQFPSNCVLPTPVVAAWVQGNLAGGGASPVGGFQALCLARPGSPEGQIPDPTLGGAYDPANYPELNNGLGLYADLGGNELPNAPHWTANLGAQYGVDLMEGWRATIRSDAYWQSQSWARVYNAVNDKLHGWYNANLSLWIENDEGLKIELYAKNILNDTPITDAFLNSDDTALTTNVFVLDPRLIGLSIRKSF